VTSQIDLSRKRDTAGWNYITASFVPGTSIQIQTNATEIVDISDDESHTQSHIHITQNHRRRRGGGSAAAASRSSATSTRESSPSPSRNLNGSAQRARSRGMTSSTRGGRSLEPPRRSPSRATKRINSMPARYYKETLQALSTRPGYSRVAQYKYYEILPEVYNRSYRSARRKIFAR
jgi:hypothetical protein